jgi:type I restriction enzyme S subunit
MKSSFLETKLGDVCEIKQGSYVAPKDMAESPSSDASIPVIGGNGILGYTHKKTFDFDVPLVTCRGSKCGLMQWGRNPSWISNNAMAVYFKDGHGDNRFLYHFLSQMNLDSVITGSAQPQITVGSLSQAKVRLPSPSQQKSIANLMESIDEKIRLNRETSATLEAIAQATFNSWFLAFEPVHAKARGEQPEGLDSNTAELFPSSFELSPIGAIPAGWEVASFGKEFALTMGQSPPGDAYNQTGDGLPFYQGRTDFGFRFPSVRVFSTVGNRRAAEGDTLISVRAPVGDTNQALDDCVIGRGVAAARHKLGSEVYTYACLSAIKPQLEQFNGEGSVFGAINRSDFEAIQIVKPTDSLLNKFDELFAGSNRLIKNLHSQTQTLTSLRDSLLKRLILGEIEIPEGLLGA